MVDVSRELLILGILRRSPLSAYDVDRAVHGHAPLYRPLKRGNVYYSLEKLVREGCLSRQETAARRGPRDTKTIYALLDPGDARFRALLRATLVDIQADDTALEVACVLLGQFDRDAALELLAARADALAHHERKLKRLMGDMASRGGAAHLCASHAFGRADAERRWLRESMALLTDRAWSPAWTGNDGPVDDPRRRLPAG